MRYIRPWESVALLGAGVPGKPLCQPLSGRARMALGFVPVFLDRTRGHAHL